MNLKTSTIAAGRVAIWDADDPRARTIAVVYDLPTDSPIDAEQLAALFAAAGNDVSRVELEDQY